MISRCLYLRNLAGNFIQDLAKAATTVACNTSPIEVDHLVSESANVALFCTLDLDQAARLHLGALDHPERGDWLIGSFALPKFSSQRRNAVTNMGKVLLTGGSGFIAAHVLKVLLERGYAVTTTVRSSEKGDRLLAAYQNIPQQRLSYVIVKDIAIEGAFDLAVQSDPPFDHVIHTASPFPDTVSGNVNDLLDPAIKGTTEILKAIKMHAPSVKRVVVTSSFAAIVNPPSPPKVYDESSWNPVTLDDVVADPSLAYRGSKTFAEKAAWDFIAKEKPGFDLVTMNPSLVYGPVIHHLQGLSALNTSNQRIRNFIQGKTLSDELPPTGTFLWIDVRDLALAHVKALKVPKAGGNRFFMTAGHCSNKWIVDAIRESHPDLASKLPKNPIDDFPKECYGYDNTKAKDILGIEFKSLKNCVDDTVTSLLKLDS